MKKFSTLKMVLMGALLLLFAVACSSDEATTNEGGTNGSGADGEVYQINIAHGNQPSEPVGKLGEKWKELAEERSEGRIQINLYPSSQLGPEADVIEQAQQGNNVVVLAGYDFLMDYVPDIGILTAPYLVENFDELIYLTKTEWFDGVHDDLRAQGIEVVTARTVYGARHLITNEPVFSPDDLNGMSIRVPNNQMSIATFDAMGAAATPMPLGDLYPSLQQGLVDGAENPLPVLQGVQAHEVSKHLSLTEHQRFLVAFVSGTSFIETLPGDILQILRETGDEASEYARGILEEEDQAILEQFKAAGVEVYEVDIEPFRESVQSVYEQFPNWTPGLYDEIKSLLDQR